MTDYSDEAVANALAVVLSFNGPIDIRVWQEAMRKSDKRERKIDKMYSDNTVDLEKILQYEANSDSDWESVKSSCIPNDIPAIG